MQITLFTVPHTGAHFLYKFFDILDVERDSLGKQHITKKLSYFHLHSKHIELSSLSITGQELYDKVLFSGGPTIVTARDPYLSAIHHLDVMSNRKFNDQVTHWNMFLNQLPNLNYHIVDIGCQPSNRFQHLIDAVNFLSLPYDSKDIKKFANDWKPENVRNTDAKAKYLETGELPGGHDWSLFEAAVAWYNSLDTNDRQ